MTVEILPPPPPQRRLPPPLPPGYRAVNVADIEIVPAKPSEERLKKAAETIQRKYRAVKACRVFKQFRTLLNQFRMRNTDPSNLQKAAKLTVRTLSSREQHRIINDLQAWKDPIALQHKEAYEDLHNVLSLADQIAYNVRNGFAGQIIAVYDETGRLQGVGHLKTKGDRIEVEHLATAPWNLDIDIFKDDPRKVKGVGTALLEETIVNSMKAGFQGEVHLDSLEKALPFYYTKMELEIAQRTPASSDLIPMKLVDIGKFLTNHGGRALPA